MPRRRRWSSQAPFNEDFNNKDASEQSEASPQREWRSAARDYLIGRITDEEFQNWVQGLIAVRGNKSSNNIRGSNKVQQAAKTPTTPNLPVQPTEDRNMSGRRRSRFFGEGEAKDNMGSIMGASNMAQQPANTPATSNFPVYSTEDCNPFQRRFQ